MGAIVGIDFGTTNSAVATVVGTEIVIIPNNYGRLTPSIVAFPEEESYIVGMSAKNYAPLNPERVVKSVKRYMGENKLFSIDKRMYNVPQIASFIIRKLIEDAQDYLGEPVEEAVITVPAYYNDRQRAMTMEAGRQAGVKVERIITEPAAAALAYGFIREGSGDANLLIYDLGGGTFDVTVLKVQSGFFKVLATDGDSHLGGDDFDEILTEYVINRFYQEEQINLKENPISYYKIKETAEKVKIELSDRQVSRFMVPFVIADVSGPKNIDYKIERKDFEQMIAPVLNKTIPLTLSAIEKSGLKVEEIDKVILVGGSTKIPLVQTILQQQLGKTPYKNINPDECVALGAAIAAGIKSGRIKKTIIRDVLPQPLGTDIDNDVMDILLDKNAPLPARKSKVYTTTEDDQDTISIKIYQGVYPKASRNQLLGEYFFSGIRKAKRGEPSIEITFKVDVNGILKVSARDLDTNKEMSWVVKREMKESESLPENKREQLEFYGQED
jgi:molecular chaperone DnaK